MDGLDIALAVMLSSMGVAVGSWMLRRLFGWTLGKFVTAVRDAVHPMIEELRCELERLRTSNHQEHEEIREGLRREREDRARLEGKVDGIHHEVVSEDDTE